MADLTGQVLAERYHIQSFLGRGGMAEVYRAWDARRMTFLALKVLHEDLALDRVFLRRFQREAETLAKLQHPHIVRFYGLEQQGRLQFMLMDFIEGQTLRERIFDANGPLPLEEVHKIFSALCSALQYAHSEGMVHCDIKPANIMLHKNGTVLLADFGIARMMESSTTTSLGLSGSGTPAYMSPEQGLGQTPTGQTDIYALGIVLFEMLTGGERPFTGEHAQINGSTVEKVRWEQVNAPAPSPRLYNPAITPEMEAIILKCLEKDPARRFANAYELWTALERAIHAEPGSKTIANLLTSIQPPAIVAPTRLEMPGQKTTLLEEDSHPLSAAHHPVAASPTTLLSAPRRSLNWLWGLLILAPVALGIWYISQQRQSQVTPEVRTIVVTATDQAAAAVSQNLPAATPAPTATQPLLPSSTPTITSTPTFTATPSPTETAPPTATATLRPQAVVQASSNCRKGPSTLYSIAYSPQAGENATILGANSEQTWLWVNFDGTQCWIAMSVINIQGDTSRLPVFTPPPTPRPTQTLIPTSTPVKALADLSCQAWYWVTFSVNQTTNVTFTFENDASVSAGSFTVRLRYEGNVPEEGNNREFRISGLGSNRDTTTITVPTTFRASGSVRTYCEVDIYNEVPEYNENNNSYYGTDSVN